MVVYRRAILKNSAATSKGHGTMAELIVDYNDISDLKRAITKLQFRRKNLLRKLGYDQINFNGSKYAFSKIVPVFESILDCDTVSIYEGSAERKFYVYVHCDPMRPLKVRSEVRHFLLASRFGLKFEPFYVGKGVGDRLLDTDRNDSYRKLKTKITRFGKEIVIAKVAVGMTEPEALSLESKLIDVLGLRCLSGCGILVNLDEGVDAVKRRATYPKSVYLNRVLRRNGFSIAS
jgi:hypothetical protein